MAPAKMTARSSLAMALAGRSEAVQIPKPRRQSKAAPSGDTAKTSENASDRLTVSVPSAGSLQKKGRSGLPTPPNSLSPSLPPQQAFHDISDPTDQNDDLPTPPAPQHMESDIDLEEAVEHAKAQDAPSRSMSLRKERLGSPDAAGDITPTMLAKYHLPDILCDNGPLAIRHILGFLTTTVPGFSGIPPAKARRIIVTALEARGDDGETGGLNEEVIFEKVGWGRWSARKRAAGSARAGANAMASPAMRPADAPRGLQIPRSHQRADRTTAVMPFGSHLSHLSHHSFGASPSEEASNPDLDVDRAFAHDEKDDEFDFCGSPMIRARRNRQDDELLDDATDEEDWANIGAKALRKGSMSSTGGMRPGSLPRRHQHHPHYSSSQHHHHSPYLDPKTRGGQSLTKKLSNSQFRKSSVPLIPQSSLSTSHSSSVLYSKLQQQKLLQQQAQASLRHQSLSPDAEDGEMQGVDEDRGLGRRALQDREAVEALMQLRSV